MTKLFHHNLIESIEHQTYGHTDQLQVKLLSFCTILFLLFYFRKRVSLIFGNPATFMATPQHLIKTSAKASVPTPNTLTK